MDSGDQMRALLDERAIVRLGMRYAAAADDHDLEGFAGCFLEDGTLDFPTSTVVGREEIRSVIAKLWTMSRASQHATTNFLVTVEGDRATMRSDVIVTHSSFARPDELWVTGAVYRDNLVKRDDAWFFHRRSIDLVWSVGDASQFEN